MKGRFRQNWRHGYTFLSNIQYYLNLSFSTIPFFFWIYLTLVTIWGSRFERKNLSDCVRFSPERWDIMTGDWHEGSRVILVAFQAICPAEDSRGDGPRRRWRETWGGLRGPGVLQLFRADYSCSFFHFPFSIQTRFSGERRGDWVRGNEWSRLWILTSPYGRVEPAQWGAVGVRSLQGKHTLIHAHTAPDRVVIVIFVIAKCFAWNSRFKSFHENSHMNRIYADR